MLPLLLPRAMLPRPLLQRAQQRQFDRHQHGRPLRASGAAMRPWPPELRLCRHGLAHLLRPLPCRPCHHPLLLSSCLPLWPVSL
jgi:hypothetical protein